MSHSAHLGHPLPSSVQADREPGDRRTLVREEECPDAQGGEQCEEQEHIRTEQKFGPELYLPDRRVRSVPVHG